MSKAQAGCVYKHYKNGKHYRVSAIAHCAANAGDAGPVVVYHENTRDNPPIWYRSRAEFEETIQLEDGTSVDRFERL